MSFNIKTETFLSLAKQFNFLSDQEQEDDGVNNNTGGSNEATEDKDFYQTILELMELQEKIGNLKLIEKQEELRERFSGLTEPSSLSWIVEELAQVSDNLSYIINNASKIQLKLANPAISNSLPLQSQLHEPLIDITKLLADIHYSADRCERSASWMNEQDWTRLSKTLNSNKHNAEKLVARLKTASSKIQVFRDGI